MLSEWSTVVTAVATAIIAGATIVNIVIYRRFIKQSLTPSLVISIRKCVHFQPTVPKDSEGEFSGNIVIGNHGGGAAHDLTLKIPFGKTNHIISIGPIVIQPHDKIVIPFSFPMQKYTFETGLIAGNRLSAQIDVSFKGSTGTKYKRDELHEYQHSIRRFVPIWSR